MYIFFYLLTSCSCQMIPAVVSCGFNENIPDIPSIAHYQKSNTIGNTDIEQRWKDIVACGGQYGDVDLNIQNGRDWRVNSREVRELLLRDFDRCMRQKGYKHLKAADCQSNPAKCNY